MAQKQEFTEIEFELLDEAVEIKKTPRGRWCKPLKIFLASGKGTIVYKCKSTEEQTLGINAINTYNRAYNLGLVCGRHGATEIYVVRA